jgi:hypothetical protein
MLPISPTNRLFSLRQSIALTVPNSFGSFLPAEPADDGPVQSHLVDLTGDVDVFGGFELEL